MFEAPSMPPKNMPGVCAGISHGTSGKKNPRRRHGEVSQVEGGHAKGIVEGGCGKEGGRKVSPACTYAYEYARAIACVCKHSMQFKR